MGAPLAYPPPPRPTSHCPAPGSRAFVFSLRTRIVCPSAPLISLLLHKLHCWASKGHQQMGGLAVTQHQRWGDGGLFSCGYMVGHVLRRQHEISVCGGKSAINRCANISYCHMVLVTNACMHMSFSPSLSFAHQGKNNSNPHLPTPNPKFGRLGQNRMYVE